MGLVFNYFFAVGAGISIGVILPSFVAFLVINKISNRGGKR